ncbi:PREDICTED: uncharacterized protein LOC109586571 [Amphimedon queenslandica]|uniref:Death domain-containing protein n=1 Tax=Amphimedon queenslandica TaxID=400682 RepID=A0AAN0JMV7_AMPQE|nr:PREDICTED: uncharacterized protein LOC109586571 [Amphimedon queenslandica]|eukprot:XP_019858329.1 PREDICTED: uncharacterized protein LOC109586571 [Amphimedon queenslandica]
MMATPTSSAIPRIILSGRTLNIDDLNEVIALLERHHFNKTSYERLGQRLNLSHNTLEEIKKDHKGVHSCFTQCLASWLRKPDGVETPTIDTLIAAVRGIGENAVADGINEEIQTVPLSTSEPMVATPPTLHTSEGPPIQPVATVNAGVYDLELQIDLCPELQEIANNLQEMYDFLVLAVKKSLKYHGIDVKDAKMLIKSCFKRKAHVVSELMPYIDILDEANDIETFFDFLNKYDFIGYLNYKLLKKLAKLVEDDNQINELFLEYEKEYDKLLNSASFQDLMPLFERKSDLSPTAPLGLPYISFRLERPGLFTSVYTWVKIFGEFLWSSYAFLKQFRKNCVIITYAILPCVLDDVMRDLKDPVILKKLEDKDVTVAEFIESPQKEEGPYERALKEQGSADVAYARLMLLGSAGTGKTCLKRSLMEEPFNPHTTSTIVSDVSSVRPFGHKWLTRKENKWREATEEDEIEEIACLFKSFHSRSSSHMHGSILSAQYSHDESDALFSTSSVASDMNVERRIQSILKRAGSTYQKIEPVVQVRHVPD